jgi:hypothetical protein
MTDPVTPPTLASGTVATIAESAPSGNIGNDHRFLPRLDH